MRHLRPQTQIITSIVIVHKYSAELAARLVHRRATRASIQTIAIVAKNRSEPAMKDAKLEIDVLALHQRSVRPRPRRTPIDFVVGVVLAAAALPVVAGDGGTGGTGGAFSNPIAIGGASGPDGQTGGTGGNSNVATGGSPRQNAPTNQATGIAGGMEHGTEAKQGS